MWTENMFDISKSKLYFIFIAMHGSEFFLKKKPKQWSETRCKAKIGWNKHTRNPYNCEAEW